MTAPTQVSVTRDEMDLLAWTHRADPSRPHIEFDDNHAYLVLDGVEYVAELTAVA
jgi:hypothetical protein